LLLLNGAATLSIYPSVAEGLAFRHDLLQLYLLFVLILRQCDFEFIAEGFFNPLDPVKDLLTKNKTSNKVKSTLEKKKKNF
jgi:hypothetical protein